MSIARPPAAMMRGNAVRSLWKTGVISLSAAFAGTAAYYYGYMKPKHDSRAEFYANYDPYVALERMCKKQMLHSCPENLAKLHAEK